MSFNSEVKVHLSKYKNEVLKVCRNGFFKAKNKEYSHILPEEHYKLNILETIREEFWIYYYWKFWNAEENSIKLHTYFHHLNSSQAMCFNLFFPLILNQKSKKVTDLFKKELNNSSEFRSGIKELQFEKVLSHFDTSEIKEKTNFDFYMELNDKKRILFEIKYSENGFGKAEKDVSHKKKYEEFYKDIMKKGKIFKTEYIEDFDLFKNNYQIIRNLIYFNEKTYIIFVFPKKNEKIFNSEEMIFKVLSDKYNEKFKNHIKIIYLEDLIENLMKNFCSSNALLYAHYSSFKKKYLF